jgi:hypothetical protein
VTAEEAKSEIARFAVANRIRIVTHARERMAQRSITYRDIRNALINASACVAGEDAGRWVVTGLDLDGEDTKVVCAIEDGVVVITVF